MKLDNVVFCCLFVVVVGGGGSAAAVVLLCVFFVCVFFVCVYVCVCVFLMLFLFFYVFFFFFMLMRLLKVYCKSTSYLMSCFDKSLEHKKTGYAQTRLRKYKYPGSLLGRHIHHFLVKVWINFLKQPFWLLICVYVSWQFQKDDTAAD